MTSPLEAAREYRRLGLHPIPCQPRGKRPLVEWKDYQEDPPHQDEIEAWWAKTPDANVALVLGRGTFAVDLDGGVDALKLLRAAGIEMPLCPVSRTGKGLHAFLSAPGPVPDRVALLKNGGSAQVDIRGVGIVVVPPSIHPTGKVYEWERPLELPLPLAPAALLDLIQRGRQRDTDGTPDASWVAEALRGVPEGQRDDTCARLAGYFLHAGLDAKATEVVLLESFAKNCTPPFRPADVRKTVQSIARKDGAGERQAAVDPQAAELRREGFALVLSWPGGIQFGLDAIRDTRDGIRGELTVLRDGRRLHWGAFALSSGQAREALRKKLDATSPGPRWGEYLEQAAYRLTQAAREGEPLVTLTGRVSSPTRALVDRMLYPGEATLVYADGDTGKSLFALALAAGVCAGISLPWGLKPSTPVLAAYLDWETSRDSMEARLGPLAAGLGITPPPIVYKRMTRPLVDEAPALAVEFARRKVGLVIVDSMMFAVASGEGAAYHEPITAFYGALRLFAPAAALVLSHVTGEDARKGGAARPFGGAFAFNGPRLVWEAKRDKDVTDATAIAFTCTKANNLPRRPEPFGLLFTDQGNVTTISALNLREAAPGVLASATLGYRIQLALGVGSRTIADLAEELDAKADTIEKTLKRMEKAGKVIRLTEREAGRPTTWGLTA
jgi:hypothetical protein